MSDPNWPGDRGDVCPRCYVFPDVPGVEHSPSCAEARRTHEMTGKIGKVTPRAKLGSGGRWYCSECHKPIMWRSDATSDDGTWRRTGVCLCR